MLNFFRFEKRENNKFLITNELGKYAFISEKEFEDLKNNRIHSDHERYPELYDKYFVFDEDKEVFIQRINEYSRTSRRYLFTSTVLFIFVMTNQCNMNCVYCQASSPVSEKRRYMTEDVARNAVDLIFSSPTNNISIEFQGGEPLLNWKIIQFIVLYAEEKATHTNKNVVFSIVSNLLLADESVIAFLKEHEVSVSTSLDGNKMIHDNNRTSKDGNGTFDRVREKVLKLANTEIRAGAIQTTTRNALRYPHEIIDTYISFGFQSIFLRPLTPLGIAKKNWDRIGYTPEEFVSFYRESIAYLLEVNKKGTFISEGHASVFLSKILHSDSGNYMELRSPCGASIGQMAINYDGKIYTCDEGRMLAEIGDSTFQIGTVYDKFDLLIESEVTKAVCSTSTLDSIPECCDCVYQPYCGTCPVLNYSLYGDLFAKKPNNYRCILYKGMLNTLFDIIEHADDDELKVLDSWTEY